MFNYGIVNVSNLTSELGIYTLHMSSLHIHYYFHDDSHMHDNNL